MTTTETAAAPRKFTPPSIGREQIVSMETDDLWAILRSTNHMSEMFANQLCWAKAELRRRGYSIA